MNKKFYYALAQSDEINCIEAANDVIDRCVLQLQGRTPSAGIVYMGITIDHRAVLDIINERIGDIELIGCTTDGEFSSESGYIQDSILLLLICSDEIDFISGVIDLNKSAPESTENGIKTSLERTDKSPRAGILLTDGIVLNPEDPLELLNRVFNYKVPFFGGVAADKWRKTETKQFYRNSIFTDAAVYLILCGEFDYSYSIGTGWEPVGPGGTVNKSDGNIVREINNVKAIDFFRDFLGDISAPVMDIPMAVYDIDGSYMFLRSTVLDVMPDDNSIPFFGNIPEGSKVRFTFVDRNSILDGVVCAVENAKSGFPRNKKPSFAVCFSCTARRAILGMRTDEECGIAKNRLGDDVAVFGFYTYGEFSPADAGKASVFHNETFVCLLLE